MIYACDKCRFLFKKVYEDGRCPDCGKLAVRAATEKEIEEYEKRRAEKLSMDK